MGTSKKNGANFLVQGSILAIASIISRIIGLVYRIPMTNIIGDTGNNYYSCAFEIYNIMLIISSYSLPLAVSKLVSARIAKGHRKAAYQVLKGSFVFAITTGTIVALIVYFGAELFTNMLQTPLSVFALKILAPVLVVVALLGVLRGFFQGMGTMMPSAISQIIEQIVNAVVSVWAAYKLFDYGKKVGTVLGDPEHYAAAYGAAGGTLGTNLGAFAGFFFMLFVFYAYMKNVFKDKMQQEKSKKTDSFGRTMGLLIATIIPVLLSTTIYNISGIIDQALFKNIAISQSYTTDEINVWWGVFSGKYKLLINVPVAIASAMAASSVPTLTASFAEGRMKNVRRQINAAMRFVMVIALPCCVGLAVLAKPIFLLLFPGTTDSLELASFMMAIGSVAVVFYSMSTLSNGLLQGINRMKAPVKNAIVALILHIIVLVGLMLIFRWHIYAVVIANAFFALIMCILNARDIARYSGYRQEILKTFIIPGIASGIMGVVTYFVYQFLYKFTNNNTISLIPSIILAVIVYAVLLLLLKGVSEEDMENFPKGNVLIRLAKKLHLLRD